jgi:hypothetical protein
MTTAQREFEQPVPAVGGALYRRDAGRTNQRARLRLLLAVAGLAALLAWGALSHVGSETSADGRGATSAQDTPLFDGRGKWTGYTSEWRSRPRSSGMPASRKMAERAWRGRPGPAPQSTWISQVVR